MNDYRIIQQLSTFVQKGSTYRAETGHHDDFVMTLVMLSWASLQPNFSEITNVRALDVYTKQEEKKETDEQRSGERQHQEPAPGVASDQKPMPVGIFEFTGLDEDQDEYWVLR